MASTIRPILTFKAGVCDVDDTVQPSKVIPRPDPGYLYLYEEDEFLHFCWRKRTTLVDEPELDLFMVDGDGAFEPLNHANAAASSPATNGRLFVLKFASSSQRHFFWLQARSADNSNPAFFSQRDLQLGALVNRMLQGDRDDIAGAIARLGQHDDCGGGGGGDDADRRDDDETMEDVEGSRNQHSHPGAPSGGGAGVDATGGDVRAEGGGAREGGADGGRAATMPQENDASAVLQNLVQSITGGNGGGGGGAAPNDNNAAAAAAGDTAASDEVFTSLGDLLTPASTIPFIDHADEPTINNLLSYLPTSLILTAVDNNNSNSNNTGNAAATAATANDDDDSEESQRAALRAISPGDKRSILRRVLRSPQFAQSLHSLTIALQDGGLPTISEALRVRVANGGYIRHGAVPLANASAIRAFLDGVKRQVSEDEEL